MNLTYTKLTYSETLEAMDELRNLALVSYGTHASVIGDEQAQQMQQNIQKQETWELLFSNSQCFVCKDGERIVGMAFLIASGNPWRFFEADWAYIRFVGVLPTYEGKGIGKHLTQLCISLAIENNEKIVALHTSEYMDAARHIYEKAGFKKYKEIEPIWGKRYWIYTLEL